MGRSRGGLTSKINALVGTNGLPIRLARNRRMTKTLLDQAKTHPSVPGFRRSYRYGGQIEDVAVARFRGHISFGQAAAVTGVKGSSVYGLLAVSLRNVVFEKRVVLRVRKTSK